MTPKWIASHASFIDNKHNLWPEELLFKTCGKPPDPALLKITLFPSHMLPANTPLTIKIKVALNTVIGTKEDSDVMIGLSDGYKFLGFEVRDKGNRESPCIGLQGVSGASISNLKYGSSDPAPHQKFYPGKADSTSAFMLLPQCNISSNS